jgi:transposase
MKTPLKPTPDMTSLHIQNVQLSERVMVLEQQLDWFKRQLFGRKSEKQLIDNPAQSSLFVSDELVAHTPAPVTDVAAHKRKSNKQHSDTNVNDEGLRFDDTVPTKIIEVSAPQLQGDDADEYDIIDYQDTCRLAQQPGSYTVLIYRRPVLRHKSQHTLLTVPAPTNVLDGCYCDVSLLAGLMVDKAVYHLPLYRQHQRMLDSGITVSRATLINWMQKGIELLRPIYQAQWRHILQSKVLAMDEVPMKAGVKKGAGKQPGNMKQSYFWPIYGEQDEIAFTWSAGRGMAHAKQQLEGFVGTLLTDGYAAYTKTVKTLNKKEVSITHANCWAHSRRTFEKALAMEPDAAQHALDSIRALYQVEKHIRDKKLDDNDTLHYRQQHSEPMVLAFFKWVYEQRQRIDLLPSNPLAKALAYVHERQTQLNVFLCNPQVPIDTNHLERALRVIPMGRKNYLFCWSELGAEQLGILQSLMVTCRLQGVNPYHYLVDVLQRVSIHPAKDVLDLTPRVWKTKFAENCLTSDLAKMG